MIGKIVIGTLVAPLLASSGMAAMVLYNKKKNTRTN